MQNTRALFLILFIISGVLLQAQDTIPITKQEPPQKTNPLRDKMFFGLSAGATFGSYTQIAIYPMAGIRVTNQFRTGMKLGYEYLKDKRYYSNFEASNYGASLFAQYDILPQIYLHLEPALYSYDAYYLLTDKNRVWVPHLYVGGGVNQQLGPNGSLFIQLTFDVLQNPNSPYGLWAPFYGIGVRGGF